MLFRHVKYFKGVFFEVLYMLFRHVKYFKGVLLRYFTCFLGMLESRETPLLCSC